MYIFLFHRKCI